ncbi:DNA polymerase III subunit gamma/tau [Desulfatiferula olefinivorans]
MAYLVLARKYRPQTFEEVVGQSHVTTTLANAVTSGRVAHAILFSGPRGTGKTTVARILAKTINCLANRETPSAVPCNTCRSCMEITSGSAVDVFEIDGASNNSVDQIRDLRDNVRYMPAHSPCKIYIIDEVHMLSLAAFNALLKTLEEPPAHVKFLFATTEPHKIPITILSRCQRHDMRRVDLDQVTAHLARLCALEGVTVEEKSLYLMAQEAGGSVRDALSLLDQVISSSMGEVSHDQVLGILGTVDRKNIFDLSSAILERDTPRVLDLVDDIYSRGHDLKKLYAKLTEHMRNLLVVKMTSNSARLVDVSSHELDEMTRQVQRVSPVYLTQIADLFFAEESRIRYASQARFALEMTLVKMLQVEPALSIDALIEKLDRLKDGLSDDPSPRSPQAPPSPDPAGGFSESRTGFTPRSSGGAPGGQPPASALPSQPTPADAPAPERPPAPQPGQPPDQTWHNFLAWFTGIRPALAACLSRSRLTEWTENRISLTVGGSNFDIRRITEEANQALLTEACREFFRSPVTLNLVTDYSEADANQKKKERNDQLRQETLTHPVVSEAIKVFDGNVDITIL